VSVDSEENDQQNAHPQNDWSELSLFVVAVEVATLEFVVGMAIMMKSI
jgi:hypothetical protein